jgi:hypothetical protein
MARGALEGMMNVCFTVSVGPNDWDHGLGAWRCPVLGVPGAEVCALYANANRIDKAWYEVQPKERIVRWVHGPDHPDLATLSIELTRELDRELASKERWQKAAIVLPFVSAIAVALIPFLFGGRDIDPAPREATMAYWTIKGAIERGPFESTDVEGWITPPDLRLQRDFTFEGQIPVVTHPDGKFTVPRIIFTLRGRAGTEYSPLVVHVVNEGDTPPPGVPEIVPRVNTKTRVIDIRNTIQFRRTTDGPLYNPAAQIPVAATQQ